VRLAEGFPRTAAWYAENRDWWEPIKRSGGYREYYEKQYAARLAAS
jgi:dTDP-glucose 4,6-dehydratase